MAEKRTETARPEEKALARREPVSIGSPFRMLDRFAEEMDRVFDDFVVAAVLVLRGERPSPLRALLQFAARDDLDAGHLLGEPCAGLLHSLRSRVDSRLSPNATVHSAE